MISPPSHRCAARCGPGLLLLVLLGASLPAQSQTPLRPELGSFPFAQWAAEGDRQEIRWDVKLTKPWLRYDQRYQTAARVRVPMGPFRQHADAGKLHLLVKVADEEGRWLPGHVYTPVALGAYVRESDIEFGVPILLRPGQYQLGIFLFHEGSGTRSVMLRPVEVKASSKLPLPGLGRDLPRIEFPEGSSSSLALRAPEEGRLHLPLQTRRPVRVEIVANISASAQYTRFPSVHRANLQNVLQIVSVLAQLKPEDGSVGLTMMDVLNMRQLVSVPDVTRLDWDGLVEAAYGVNPSLVDVRSLERRRQVAAYFQQQISAMLAPSPTESEPPRGGAAEKLKPMRVFIVVGNPMLLPPGTRVPRLESEEDCDCRVYLLLPKVRRSNLWDELGNVFRPLQPRRFILEHPGEFRKALGEMLEDLSGE